MELELGEDTVLLLVIIREGELVNEGADDDDEEDASREE